MHDLFVALAFLVMVLSPCLVAMNSGVGIGADLGVRNPMEAIEDDSHGLFVPR